MDRRSYGQYCGVARALDIVGERWTLLIVRDLLLGPRRYSELLHGLPGITTNLLAKRLKEMEAAGMIERVRAATSETGHSYRLTSLGLGLEPAVQALASWGWRSMTGGAKKGEQRQLEWFFVVLRPRYRGGAPLRAELVADDVPYRVLLDGSRAEISRGEAPAPDVRLRGTALALYRMFREPPPRGRAPTGVEVEGPVENVRKLVQAFAVDELTFS
jgi:DNA-binding HxlR family transcriptional regulator